MKRQTPSTNPQGRSKHQALGTRRTRRAFTYPVSADRGLLLNEVPTQNDKGRHPFDLEERTARFGEAIVRFSKKIPRNPTNNRLIDQLVGCGTSVGGNYCEADERVSKKGFS
jgi:hypothetical protein